MTASARLETHLSAALRSLEPASVPARTRLRISADLRGPAQRRQRWRRAGRLLSAAASIALLLLWAGLIVLVANSVAMAGPAAAPTSGPVFPPPSDQSFQLPDWPVLWDPPALALIAGLGVLAGLAASTRWIRAGLARLVSSGEQGPERVRPWPRRPWKIPKLALFLALLPASYMVTQPFVGAAPWPPYSSELFLSASLGWAAALRYPGKDRSGRWLIAGGTIVAIGRPFSLDAYAYIAAAGWTCIAIGLAVRADFVPRPRWLTVAAVVALALWLEIDSATHQLRSYGGPSGDWDPQRQLLMIAVLRACALVALVAALWAGWKGWRTGGGRPWFALLVGMVGWLAIEIYDAQIYWLFPRLRDIGLLQALVDRLWDLGLLQVWNDAGLGAASAWYALELWVMSLFSLIVLIGLLGGLEAVHRRPPVQDVKPEDGD